MGGLSAAHRREKQSLSGAASPLRANEAEQTRNRADGGGGPNRARAAVGVSAARCASVAWAWGIAAGVGVAITCRGVVWHHLPAGGHIAPGRGGSGFARPPCRFLLDATSASTVLDNLAAGVWSVWSRGNQPHEPCPMTLRGWSGDRRSRRRARPGRRKERRR
jgi:hypothetical protein